ncbi:DoxX family protein [Nemorincola caseinilytica]|uniref:DoxX family protein n=1 Tax=Nemorincola caseinilytica TaxID=2054315 RepID=A0ABP8NIH1_9BACT
MTKRNKIIYWIATVWMSLGMVSSGIVQLLGVKEEVQLFTHLGYPLYLMTIIGVWKMLGVIVVLMPRLPLLKEWAYAGFFFTMSGAFFSHLIVGGPASEIFPSVLLMALIATSWYFRPADKKMVQAAR